MSSIANANVESQASDLDSRRAHVFAAQVATTYQQLPFSVLGQFLISIVLVGFMFDRVANVTLGAWFVSLALALGITLAVARTYRHNALAVSDAWRWARYLIILAVVRGVLWGVAAFVLWVPGDLVAQALLTLTIVGLMTAAPLGSIGYTPSYLGVVFPSLVPLIARTLWEGTWTHWIMAAGQAIGLILIVLAGRSLTRQLTQTFETRYENQQLIDRLREEKASAEQARAQAEAARAAAERASSEKTHFLAAASHDLRQPVHALALLSGALRSRLRDDESIRIADRIEGAIESLDALFHGLLDISRLDAGTVKVERARFAVQGVFDAIEEHLAPLARDKGVALRLRPSALWLDSDPILLERIVRNLVANAIQYTQRGGVLVACRAHGETASIEVWDTGIGIPAGQFEAIFQEFVQLNNPARDRRKGMGLGLAIVRRTAALLGVAIELESRVGYGSKFGVRVARAHKSAGETAAVRHAPVEMSVLAGRTVAIIDDEPEVLDALETVLQSWGCIVLRAEDGPTMASLLIRERPAVDAVITDFRLRNGQTGADAVRQVTRALNRRVPSIIVTGDTDPRRLTEAAASGFYLLHKPVRAEALARTLADAIA